MGMQPDQTEFFFIVVISGGAGSGLFVYNPVTGAGTLVGSIAGQGGFDSFGNDILAGLASYATSGTPLVASQLSGGNLRFLTSATEAGPWQLGATVGLDTLVTGPTGDFGLQVTAAGLIIGGLAFLPPSNDFSGATDRANLNAVFGAGFSARLLPGGFFLDTEVTVAGAALEGSGTTTIIQPGFGYGGALLAAGSNSAIRNLFIKNSSSDAITVAGGVSEWWLENLRFSGNTGLCVNATVTGPTHGDIHHIRGDGGGAANGGGIFINGGTGGAITCEINVSDIDIQGCLTAPVYHLACVTDVNCAGPFNGSVAAGSGVNAIAVEGACQNCDLGPLDVGGSTTAAVLRIFKGAGVNSPSQIHAGPGVVQQGAIGVEVDDASARLDFDRVWATRNQDDGWLWQGTGADNTMTNCGGNNNNLSGAGAYDVDVTGSVHLLNDGFRYVSGGVTAGRNLTVGNHYTEANPPSSLTTAGAVPGGW
jgi:hypothetical protein